MALTRKAGGWLLTTLAGAALCTGPAGAQKAGPVTVEKVAYGGWANNLKISNGTVEVVVTLDVGPRVIRYGFVGGKNVLKEYPAQLGKAGEPDWQIRGGHRLWVAPEDLTRTYAPDNGPVEHKTLEHGIVQLIQKPDAYGLQKEISVGLAPTGTEVAVIHRIKNVGKAPTELAPWALTVLAPGGTEIIPLPPKKPHPGSVKNAKSPADFAPDVTLSLWPYFDFKDPRWTFGHKYLLLKQEQKRGPTKLGLAHRHDWVAYWNGGDLFVKHLPYYAGKPYPDGGVNFETFTSDDMLEMESLGPLVTLAPGAETTYPESWNLFKAVPAPADEAAIDQHVAAKVGKK